MALTAVTAPHCGDSFSFYFIIYLFILAIAVPSDFTRSAVMTNGYDESSHMFIQGICVKLFYIKIGMAVTEILVTNIYTFTHKNVSMYTVLDYCLGFVSPKNRNRYKCLSGMTLLIKAK